MPPKKSAGKKSPGKPDLKKSAKDARRTFEHLGRVHALMPLVPAEIETLKHLTHSADLAFRAGLYSASADLLRAAEHLSFGSLHLQGADTVSSELEAAIREEFEHLVQRREEHAEKRAVPEALEALMTRMGQGAAAAMQSKQYRGALELARGAEALSHVHQLGGETLPGPAPVKGLQG